MKSLEQAKDLINIVKASGAGWSHELSDQYKARMKSLNAAIDRQNDRFNFGDIWTQQNAEIKLDEILETLENLTVLYCKLFNQFKESKQNESKVKN